MAMVILNDVITFSPEIYRGNGMKEVYSIQSMITKHGFFIPLEMKSFNYLDILDGVTKRIAKSNNVVPALLITKDRLVYELTLDGASMCRRRLGYPGIQFFVRDITTNVQEGIASAYDLLSQKDDEIYGQDLINIMADNVTYYKRNHVTYSIDELAAMVADKYPDK